ncbi:predicted protein [Streptomyces sp. AA4]|nr:predicted protein [Streptomyces sp. AA4]
MWSDEEESGTTRDMRKTRKELKLCLLLCVFVGTPLIVVASMWLGRVQWVAVILDGFSVVGISVFLIGTRRWKGAAENDR